MLLISQALGAALSLHQGRVGFATATAIGVVDGTGRVEWSVPVSGFEPTGVALVGTELWVFGDGEVWVFSDGRLSRVYGAPGGPAVRSVEVGAEVRAWTGAVALRFGKSPAGARWEPVEVAGVVGAGFGAATSQVRDRLPPDEPCTLFSETEAACGRGGLRRVRIADGVGLGALPGEAVLASGPAGLIVGPVPAFVGKDGAPRAQFDPADAWAVGTDAVFAARADELRAFSLDGSSRWVTRLAPARPPLTGLVVEGSRTTLVVDPMTGGVLGGWLGPAGSPVAETGARALATVKGRAVRSVAEVGKGRRRHPVWTMTLAEGETVVENAATLVIVSDAGWRLIDGRSGKTVGAGEGRVEERRQGWLRVRGAAGQKLVRIETGQELTFDAGAEIVGVLDGGAVVLLEHELVVTDKSGSTWRAPRPAEARVAGDLVLCRDGGVVYAREAAGGKVRWAVPFGEPLR